MAPDRLDQGNRLPAPWGRWLDRSRTLQVSFDGRGHAAHPGDSLASALWAGGTVTVGRSFKLHRPRGCLTLTGDDANDLVQAGPQPNARAAWLPARDGLAATAQNVLGSARRDGLALMRLAKPFLPVGFYYRGLFKPAGTWPWWEKLVRRAAGLGRVDTAAAHPSACDKAYLFADVAVLGGGPAGMQAAVSAARSGAEVVLVEAAGELGGHLLYERPGAGGGDTRAGLVGALAHEPGIAVLAGAHATGWYDDHFLAIQQGERLYKLRSAATIVATGSSPHPALFPNNDRPGIVTPQAAQRLLHLYGVRPGRRAVVAALDERDVAAALDLQDAGIAVAAVAALTEQAAASSAAGEAARTGAAILRATAPVDSAAGTGGRIKAVKLAGPGEAGTWYRADLLAVRGGDQPAAALAAHGGARLAFDPARGGYAVDPDSAGPGVFPAGRLAGRDGNASAADGAAAGAAAARFAGFTPADGAAERPGPGQSRLGLEAAWLGNKPAKTFVDFDEDVTVADLQRAIAEGFDHPDLLKRFTTAVMGPSQGKHSAVNFLRVRAAELGEAPGAHQPTTNRPPAAPEPIKVLAGRGFQPVRATPMDGWHRQNGAQMMPAGLWWRPAYYGPRAERSSRIEAEVRQVRQQVGLIDVATLGGLLIRGPDAARFMNRAFSFAYTKQPVGRVRYMLLVSEDGRITDDGVACRLGTNEFYVTATTGGVDAAYRLLLRLNAEWGLAVDIVNVTASWAGVNVAGPQARAVLQNLASDLDFSAAAFPYMNVQRGHVAGIPAAVFRVGFVGELGFEIHVPAGYGRGLWDALLEAGSPHGLRPFGVEAQRILRLEKGHILVGQDTDGMSHPSESLMGWAVARKKGAFHGSAAIRTLEGRPYARQLVGLTLPAGSPVPEQACLTLADDASIAGRVTSVAQSPTLGYPVALAYVAPHQAAAGTPVAVKLTDGRRVTATVTPPPFYDPDNTRQEV